MLHFFGQFWLARISIEKTMKKQIEQSFPKTKQLTVSMMEEMQTVVLKSIEFAYQDDSIKYVTIGNFCLSNLHWANVNATFGVWVTFCKWRKVDWILDGWIAASNCREKQIWLSGKKQTLLQFFKEKSAHEIYDSMILSADILIDWCSTVKKTLWLKSWSKIKKRLFWKWNRILFAKAVFPINRFLANSADRVSFAGTKMQSLRT